MAGEVTVDALPYVDTGYDEPGIREAALALVEEETRRYRPTKNYLEHLPPVDVAAFETEIMKTEFERLSHRQPMEMLNMKRYELPQPPAGKMNDHGMEGLSGEFHRPVGASSVSHLQLGIALRIRRRCMEGAQRNSFSHDRTAAEAAGRDAAEDSGD